MKTTTAERVSKHREKLKAAGLRPIQIWVPDTRRKGFADNCRRQSRMLKDDPQEAEVLAGRWTLRIMTAGVKRIRRGDLVTVALPGNDGKPGPALVIQSGLIPRASISDDSASYQRTKTHAHISNCNSTNSREWSSETVAGNGRQDPYNRPREDRETVRSRRRRDDACREPVVGCVLGIRLKPSWRGNSPTGRVTQP